MYGTRPFHVHLDEGVASIGNILYWARLTLYGKTFQVQSVHRWTGLIRDRNCEEDQHVALINLFEKTLEQSSSGM